MYDWFNKSYVKVEKIKDPEYMEFESHRAKIVSVPKEEVTAEKAHAKMLKAEERLAIC
jgi:hypothetical protein